MNKLDLKARAAFGSYMGVTPALVSAIWEALDKGNTGVRQRWRDIVLAIEAVDRSEDDTKEIPLETSPRPR